MEKLKIKLIKWLAKQIQYKVVLVKESDDTIIEGDKSLIKQVVQSKLIIYKLVGHLDAPFNIESKYFKHRFEAQEEMERQVKRIEKEFNESKKRVSFSIRYATDMVFLNNSRLVSIQAVTIRQ